MGKTRTCLGRRRSGYTLVEMVVSVTICGVLMVGLASALYVASRACSTGGPHRDALAGSVSAADVLAELQLAVSFTERSPTAVEFTVADRDGDESPETIRYAWSGTPGDPLTRQYNGGTAVTVVEDVEQFELSYLTRSVTTTETGSGDINSGEILLASFEGWAGIPNPTKTACMLNAAQWVSEFFTANVVPPDATRLAITRVELQMRQGLLGGSGTFSVAIHYPQGAGNPEPQSSPIGTPDVRSSSYLESSWLWREFDFSDVVIDAPGTEYVIVVKGNDASSYDAAVLIYGDAAAPADDTVGLWTADGGATWHPGTKGKDDRNDYDFLFRAYGWYESPGTGPIEVTRYFLDEVHLKLRVGADALARVDAGVHVLNAPEVSSP